MRVLHSDDQMDGGDLLRVAGSKPRQVVVVVELGVVENDTGDNLGGRRSLGEVEPEATGHGEARGVVCWAPASVKCLILFCQRSSADRPPASLAHSLATRSKKPSLSNQAILKQKTFLFPKWVASPESRNKGV